MCGKQPVDLPQVIMAWYHMFNKKVNSGSSFKIEKAFHEMTKTIPKAPKIMHTTQFYSKKYYTTRLKPTIDTEWALVKDNILKPSCITLSNNIMDHIYKSKTQSFKDRLEVERQDEHMRDVSDYKKKLEVLQNTPDSREWQG
jgi:hypothetical protein